MRIMSTFAVIGAGASGLMAANLITERGATVSLFESHSLPGGCASWFRRQTSVGACSFDVGATVVPCFETDSWWTKQLTKWNLTESLEFAPSQQIDFAIDGHTFSLSCQGGENFLASLARAFPSDARWINEKLRPAYPVILELRKLVEARPQWPIESIRQLWINRKLITPAVRNLAGLPLLVQSFESWLAGYELSPQLERWLNMTTLISIQCKPRQASAMYVLFAIFFHGLGCGTFRQGMRRYFEVLLKHFRSHPHATYLPNTTVCAVNRTTHQRYALSSATGSSLGTFDHVIFSCPRMQSERLLQSASPAPHELPSDLWATFSMYLVVHDHETWPEGAFNWHISDEQIPEEIFVSFSRRDDPGRAPTGYRCVSVSRHELLDATWTTSDEGTHALRKKEKAQRMREALVKVLPDLKIVHEESASPRTWERYTRRPLGTVGGLPLSTNWTLWNTPSRFLGTSRLIQVGDTSFPGQSLYSCALSAAMAVDTINF